MEFEPKNQFTNGFFEDPSDFKYVLEKYLSHYKLFILSAMLLGIISFFYVRLLAPKYNISATILVKDKGKNASLTDLAVFESVGLFENGENSLENEIQILKSRRLMTKLVKELHLNIQYFLEDSPYDKELYPNTPIIIQFQSDSVSIENIYSKFEIRIKSNKSFDIIGMDGKLIVKKNFGDTFVFNLGTEDIIDEREISIGLSDNFNNDLVGKNILVYVNPIEVVVNKYLTDIVIEPVNDKISNVLSMSIDAKVRKKGIAILNNLIDQYNADGIEDANKVSQAAINFLNERLDLISVELVAIERLAQQFKSSKGLLGGNEEASFFLQSSSSNERELIVENTQLEFVNYVLGELNKSGEGKLLPVNVGLSDSGIDQLIKEFNSLILERNRILKSSSIRNPIIVNIDSQLKILKNNLKNSLYGLKSSTQIKISALSEEEGRINSKIASIPKDEREYKNIIREQETKNDLYLFLLQKREESILSNDVGLDKAKIINSATSGLLPISPKKNVIYLAAILLGLMLPALVIYINDIFDTKVHNERDLSNLKIPYIGDVPLTKSKNNLFVKDGDNSNVSEAFRYIRTNINFMLDNKEKGKTIFVTSTQSDEGKTFTSINLATSLAISGKKTLLLGLDLRVSKITKVLDLEEILGVTNYIKNKELNIDAITETFSKVENLHVINSGDIPPNPVELLMSNRVQNMFEEIKKKYEYIVVDTAPVGLVTDTIQISSYADLTLYVVKANYLDKRMLQIPDKLNRDKKLLNMAMLINGSDQNRSSYGYGYGYGNGTS